MLKQRIITALVLAPLVIAGIVLLPSAWFALFAAVVLFLGAWEWADIAGFKLPGKALFLSLFVISGYVLWVLGPKAQAAMLALAIVFWLLACVAVVLFPKGKRLWSTSWSSGVCGLLILVAAWSALLQLKLLRTDGLLILFLMMMIWAADIGAYFAGRHFGGRKLAPQVSPGKTWAGVYGGLLSALIFSLLFVYSFTLIPLDAVSSGLLLVVALLTVSISVVGDLTESMLKRNAGVKDSGKLLPGHGGVLDRIDSLLAALPFFTLMFTSLF